MTEEFKRDISKRLVEALAAEHEVRRVVVFGSFFDKEEPNDIDVAIFVDSDEKYLPLAMKYRRLTRDIGRQIPMDILPINRNYDSYFLDEVTRGRIIYER